ncbi:hypothetical protein IR083_07620 [Dysgonomonas sp. GY75]|uniref:hypothetical protein n=1 Tax=Dysgonomonas sp. GY75 TaxID=2780419 RepID=UPI00188397D1|nr:hypothetical protein [Dysgonomonas sp. GY75]MBF0648685.1 hypothetical protein [Dysgonomonas sp. GY75]
MEINKSAANKEDKKRTLPFVKYYTGLSYMFSPAETRFILHMVDIEYKKQRGRYTDWNRAGYMKIMGLTEYAFDKCAGRLIRLGLLSKTNNAKGNKVRYSFDMELYGILVHMLNATCDIGRLGDFCKKNFIDRTRPIRSITGEEIEELKNFPAGM